MVLLADWLCEICIHTVPQDEIQTLFRILDNKGVSIWDDRIDTLKNNGSGGNAGTIFHSSYDYLVHGQFRLPLSFQTMKKQRRRRYELHQYRQKAER